MNPEPVRVAPLMVSGAVPEDVSNTDWLTGVFIATVPNATEVVLTASPGTAVIAPIPLSVTVSVALSAVTDRVPLALPAAVGLKSTVRVYEAPAAIVRGMVAEPAIEKGAPVTWT